jgi:hypothetical protein
MNRKITQGLAAFAALGALALGGSAVAGAVQSNNATAPVVKQAPSKAQENTSGPDTDSIQSGDQTTPDKGSKEAPGTEQSAASEQSSESSSESSSEVAGNDGPGGHADEPGNANADHQAEGQE